MSTFSAASSVAVRLSRVRHDPDPLVLTRRERHHAGQLRRDAVADLRTPGSPSAALTRRCTQCGSRTHGAVTVTGAALSTSHCRGLVAVAVWPGHARLGVDVELVGRARLRSLDTRICTVRELDALPSSEDDREEALHRLWTGKEAVLKMTREGLRRDPRTVELHEPAGPLPAPPRAWVQSTHLPGGWVLSLARPTTVDGVGEPPPPPWLVLDATTEDLSGPRLWQQQIAVDHPPAGPS